MRSYWSDFAVIAGNLARSIDGPRLSDLREVVYTSTLSVYKTPERPMSFNFKHGTKPLLISFPHNGSTIPAEIGETMTDDGLSSRDTDWYLDRLYDFRELEQASVLKSDISRYVIDLNRPSTNESLYPGQITTGLIPQTCFDGSRIYKDEIPDDGEAVKRIALYWKPYHQAIQNELVRLTNEYGVAVLLEAHSIASKVPRLFDGQLSDFNLGTHHGKSCSLELEK